MFYTEKSQDVLKSLGKQALFSQLLLVAIESLLLILISSGLPRRF